MSKSEELRANKNQHAPKNIHSKADDKEIHIAMIKCIEYLNERFNANLRDEGWQLHFQDKITFGEMLRIIKTSGVRSEFDNMFPERSIIPDGGFIMLSKRDSEMPPKIVVVSEVKKQGTNKQRLKEGKPKQAQGNAIERLGKNLTGIRAMLNHERITPFVCFGWGCDFNESYTTDDFVMSKVSMMNEFYALNKTYVNKRDGNSDRNFFAPVSMYFREERWTADEMFNILKEVGETSMRYYLF